MTWTPNGAGSYIKFYGASDAEKNNLIDSAKSGTPTFASGDVTVPVNTGAVITNVFRNTTAATFYGAGLDSIGAVDTSGIQGGNYLQGDGTGVYTRIPTLAHAIGDTVEMNVRIDGTSGLNGQIVDGDNVGARLYVYGQTNISFNSAVVTLVLDGVAKGSPTGVLNIGQVYNFVFTVTAACNSAFIGSRFNVADFFHGIMSYKHTSASTGLTTIYALDNVTDNGDGTANAPQTGTSAQADATVNSFVAATDITTVPNNTFSYDLSEGSGTTLGSTPSGKNITLVNNPTWN
jgi:hypothetical protein